MIRRGTTPTLRIKLKNVPSEYIKRAILTLKQGKTILNLEPMIVGDEIQCTLSQEQTLAFDTGVAVSVQIKAQLINDKVVGSKIRLAKIDHILNEEVMT